MISKGAYFLNCAATGSELSKYHIEATIAYWGTQRIDTPEKWKIVLGLYDQLLMLAYSPVAMLNRIYVLSKVNGKKSAIIEAEKLNLTNDQFYYTLLGDLYTDIDNKKAKENFGIALSIAKSDADKLVLMKKIENLPFL